MKNTLLYEPKFKQNINSNKSICGHHSLLQKTHFYLWMIYCNFQISFSTIEKNVLTSHSTITHHIKFFASRR